MLFCAYTRTQSKVKREKEIKAMSEDDKKQAVSAILKLQNDVEQEEQALQTKYPDIFARIQEIETAKKAVDNLWENLKASLVEAGDTDVHEVSEGDYKCRFSISKTSKIGVVDIDKVPEQFVEVKKVADAAKLKQYYELYGEVPEGCEDKSFYRLNKRIISQNQLGEGIDG